MRRARLATRGSALAIAQARLVARLLEQAEPGLDVELRVVRTSGDERPAAPGTADDKSRWVREIEDALLAGDADLAVHSAKDVPGELPDGLAIVGVPARADARDALCGARSVEQLPSGALVGTSSLRRRAQLLAARPDLRVGDLRGNVDTRLRRLDEGRFAAIVLAKAGLARLGRTEGAPLDPEWMTPAPGQGCLALEARSDNHAAVELAERVQDPTAALCLAAERSLVTAIGASCRTPLGAYAERVDGRLRLSAFVGHPDGSEWIRDALDGNPAAPGALGLQVAERLRLAGAGALLSSAEAEAEAAAEASGAA